MNTRFTLTTTIDKPFVWALRATRDALADQGFGIVSEINLAATLKQKIDVEVPAQVILGACRPQLAHAAIQADPSIATVLPCNVVVRALDDNTCVVEAFDPDVMTRISDNETLKVVADEARTRLAAALSALNSPTPETLEH